MEAYVLGVIFVAWFLSLFLVAYAWPPLALLVGRKLADGGWALSRVVGWVGVSLVVWFIAHLRLPVNTTWFIWTVLLLGTGLSGWVGFKNWHELKALLADKKWFMVVAEALFIVGLVALSLIRSHNPNIQDLEKPMDAGFMNSYMRAAMLPAPDMWLSGHTINYYSFGHFMGSVLSRIWLLPVGLSYNLLLAFIMGLSFALSFSVVTTLLSSWRVANTRRWGLVIGGIVGALLVTVGGNTHTIWFKLAKGTWQGYWYADATRFIDRTIHEFPAYSFVVADIHGHVWGLPLVLSFLLIAWLWLRSLVDSVTESTQNWWQELTQKIRALWRRERSVPGYIWPSVWLGVWLGLFLMTSTWDFLIYGLLLMVLGVLLISYRIVFLLPLILSGSVALIVALLTALPWLVHFDSISEGVALATEHSPWWQLLVLWSGHVSMSVVGVLLASFGFSNTDKKQATRLVSGRLFMVVMSLTAWFLLLLPELIYFKDIYTGHPRANTMFKFTYQGFILMSLVGGVVAGWPLLEKRGRWWFRAIVGSGMVALVCVLLTFPYFGFRDYYGALHNFKGLYGYSWLQESRPDDYSGIVWLMENVKGQPVVLEAVGESYTDFAQVSAVTGLPTVLGWRVHEWLWRGGFDIPGQRTTEVETMYQKPLSKEGLDLFRQHRVEYIFIGTKERETYKTLSELELERLGTVVFTSGMTKIIRVNL